MTPLCAPSRSAILTGLYGHRTGVTANDVDLDYEATETIAMALQRAGYATALFGKCHLGLVHTVRPGFDHWEAFAGRDGHGRYVDAHFDMNGTVAAFPGYSTEVLTDHVIDWLRERDEAPFFLMLSFKSAHVPLLAHPRAAGIYGDVEIMPPIGYDDPPELLPKTV